MRFFGIILILCLTFSGYVSAANAFGLVSSCPKEMMVAQGMKDCCDKGGKAKPANCLSCQCCTAAVFPTALEASKFELAEYTASEDFYTHQEVILTDFNYLPLRPPNSFA